MNRIITNLIVLIALFISNSAVSQTNVSGSIHSNTTWTLANSPYHITGSVYVFPGNKLTIEPGVKVIFDGNFDLEIRGEIVANGTSAKNIHFCGKMVITGPDTSYVLWNRLYIEPNNNGKGSFSHCVFKDAETALVALNSTSPLSNCIFEYNNVGIAGLGNYFSSSIMLAKNCTFRYNQSGIRGADKVDFKDCKFLHNDEGMYNGHGCFINDCEFSYNRNGLNIYRGNIKNSTFTYNKTAIKAPNFDGGVFKKDTIRKCDIQYNDNGIDDSAYSSGSNLIIVANDISYNKIGYKVQYAGKLSGGNAIVKNNKICHNSVYNVVNMNNANKNFTDNCFCTEDSAVIESKLYDGYDDVSLGLLTYNVYDNSCGSKQMNVFKKLPVDYPDTGCHIFSVCNTYLSSSVVSPQHRAKLDAVPNPFSDHLKIDIKEAGHSTIYITDMFGKTAYSFNTDGNAGQIEIKTADWNSGLYIITISTPHGISTAKVIKD